MSFYRLVVIMAFILDYKLKYWKIIKSVGRLPYIIDSIPTIRFMNDMKFRFIYLNILIKVIWHN